MLKKNISKFEEYKHHGSHNAIYDSEILAEPLRNFQISSRMLLANANLSFSENCLQKAEKPTYQHLINFSVVEKFCGTNNSKNSLRKGSILSGPDSTLKILRFTECVADKSNERAYTTAIFFDVSKAYYTVWTTGRLYRLDTVSSF
jgi:hypothetical protein